MLTGTPFPAAEAQKPASRCGSSNRGSSPSRRAPGRTSANLGTSQRPPRWAQGFSICGGSGWWWRGHVGTQPVTLPRGRFWPCTGHGTRLTVPASAMACAHTAGSGRYQGTVTLRQPHPLQRARLWLSKWRGRQPRRGPHISPMGPEHGASGPLPPTDASTSRRRSYPLC